MSWTLSLICLALLLVPVAARLWQARGRWLQLEWPLVSAILAILGALASIAAGRSEFGLEWAKLPRYGEIAVLLVPLSAMMWGAALGRIRERGPVLLTLWVFFFLAFSNDWSFDSYRIRRMDRLAGLECLSEYYEGHGNPLCPSIYPRFMPVKLERARELQISFYQELEP